MPEFIDIQMNIEDLNLNLSFRPYSYPPRLETVFSCCFCPKKFQELSGFRLPPECTQASL
jgi:hypothetical protein